MRVQIAHTSVALNKANAMRGKPRTVPMDAAKMKQGKLWRLEKCDVIIKALEARGVQLEALGAVPECLQKLVARLKHDRLDDDAEDERDEEIVSCDCFSPQRTASPGASQLRRRTEREVRRDSCGKEHIVFAEGDAMHVLCATVSFKRARRRVVQTSSRVMCDSCGRSVSAVSGCLLTAS